MSERRAAAEGFEKGNAGERPECCTDEHLEWLDELRTSGVCNMFGARPYLAAHFPELTNAEAAEVLGYWMKSYGQRHPEK